MTTSSDPTLKVLVGVVVAVAALAVAVVALRPATAPLDPASPEGVVQQFLDAWLERDEDVAVSLLIDGEDCEPHFFDGEDTTLRAVLEGTEVEGDRAEVRVAVTETYGEPLDSSQYTSVETFDLERTEEGWRIDQLPHRFELCPERSRP